MADSSKRETLGFQTEVRQLLQLMIHSLYSNKEIFLRELISNASDAADKLRFEALAKPELLGRRYRALDPYRGRPGKPQLTVIDNGIGMSREELIENLGTIARSGTAEFLQQMTGDTAARCAADRPVRCWLLFGFHRRRQGHRRDTPGRLAAQQRPCAGSPMAGRVPDREIEQASAAPRHAAPEGRRNRVRESLRLETLIRKYSDHIGFPVSLLDQTGPRTRRPSWSTRRRRSGPGRAARSTTTSTRSSTRHLSHDFADPLTWSHNRVEGKREYTACSIFLRRRRSICGIARRREA